MAGSIFAERRRSAGLPIALCTLLLSGGPAFAQDGRFGFLNPMGPIADAQLSELIWAAAIILVAVLPVLIGTPFIYYRYRRSRKDSTYRPDWDFSTRLEILQWGIPTLIVIALSVWMAQAVFLIDPYRSIDTELAERLDVEISGDPVRVDVIGLDWKWLFVYPDDGVASVGEMVIPVGRPVEIPPTTETVMQSFMAPGLAGQIYAMPGMTTRLSLLADEAGETVAMNTQYNGEGFARQRSPVRAVDDAAFAQWQSDARGGRTLDADAYARLATSGDLAHVAEMFDGTEGAPLQFDLAEPQLFERVLARYHGGDPVPPELQPGSPSYDPTIATLPEARMEAHQ